LLGRLDASNVFLGRDGGGRLAVVRVAHADDAADPDAPQPWYATEYRHGSSLAEDPADPVERPARRPTTLTGFTAPD